MQLAAFLSALQRHSLPNECPDQNTAPTDADVDVDVAQLHAALRKLDEAVRLDRPEELPELDLGAAAWATQRLRDLWRDILAPDTRAVGTAANCPGDPQNASTHFSVDLVLRHLPYIAGRADSLTANDPRRANVRKLAEAWPLSSVGIAGLQPTGVATILAHDGLRRTYAERILRRRDTDRQQDDKVQQAVDAVMAEHREFATEVLAVHDELIKRPQQ